MSREDRFLVDAARLKLNEITAQLSREESQIANKKVVAKLYVQLLEEWLAAERDSKQQPDPFRKQAGEAGVQERRAEFIKKTVLPLAEKAEPSDKPRFDKEFVEELLSGPLLERTQAETERFCVNTLHKGITMSEVQSAASSILLGHMALDKEDKALLARVCSEDTKLAAEYASVLSIMLKNFDSWKWNDALQCRVCYYHAKDKFRLFCQEDTVTALFLEVLGQRWIEHLVKVLGYWHSKAHKPTCAFAWTRDNTDKLFDYWWLSQVQERFCLSSLPRFNMQQPSPMVDFGYDTEHTDNTKHPNKGGSEDILIAISSLCRFHDVYPPKDDTLGIVVSDIRDLGFSLGHDLIIQIIERLGATPAWVNFFRKYMGGYSIKLGQESWVLKAGRGLLFAHSLSHALSESVLFCLDLAMLRAGAPLARFHDDVTFYGRGASLESAWQQFRVALTALGLDPNLEKTGSIWLSNDNQKKQIVEGDIEWRALRLGCDGKWTIKPGVIERLVMPLDSNSAILRLVNEYNKQLKILATQLGPISVALGLDHAAAFMSAMCNAEKRLSGGTDSFVTMLREEICKRFGEDMRREVLVEGWFYWPVGAGGLLAEHASLRAKCAERELQAILSGRPSRARSRSRSRRFRSRSRSRRSRSRSRQREHNRSRSRLKEQNRKIIPPLPPRDDPEHWLDFLVQYEKFSSNRRDFKEHVLNVSERDPKIYKFNVKECLNHYSFMEQWSGDVMVALDALWDYPVKEAPPMVVDEPLQQMISDFLNRTNQWNDLGGKKPRGLGAYTENIVAKYGNDLQRVFGTLGLIPSDLVPHSLLHRIRGERISMEIPSGGDRS